MSVNKKTQGKNAVERREIVESNTVELKTVLSAARDRRGRPRAQDGTRPLRDISEIPEGLRPFARYLSGRNARETSMAAYRKKAIAAQSYLIEAGMDQALGGLALNAFPWHFITPSVAFEYTQLLSRRYANVKTRENLLSVVRRIVVKVGRMTAS